MHNLEQYYTEEAWRMFSALYMNDWTNSPSQQILLKQLNNETDISATVVGIYGDAYCNQIIFQKIPALDNLSILDCMGSIKLRNRLKEMLMRCPY
ncbi:hypothetical protein AAEO56_13185 [Flavobacterium sp. DGU11]|uniref:Uncharacterized protein n=1 Tax=Flavobacterium arundinis TaxID=3139143 RepID=A0ABU9HYH6_9FLAO